jgi:hypothetical protein
MRFNYVFREPGLSIGLRAARRTLALAAKKPPAFGSLHSLSSRIWLCCARNLRIDMVEDVWREAANRRGETRQEHQDIHAAMLATSAVPERVSRSDARYRRQ